MEGLTTTVMINHDEFLDLIKDFKSMIAYINQEVYE